MSSDSQENQSFNQLNKLNPLISDNDDENINQNDKTQSLKNNNSQLINQNDIIMIPKKQLTLMKQNKPRLIIDHMILKNFKSYAGVQKIGPFHKNFTSIVGPNGSGKSNLIQSMLFIFGFSASWMRLNKLQQLIHNSSSSNNITSAAVEVHFKKVIDNNDGTITQIPDSSFFIRRTVNSSSVSKYFIDGKDSTQLQVKNKLKSQGIDLTNNRFLILQGEVEQISQMKQKSGDRDKPGFLQYLEDIIGSNQYIQKIQQAVKQFNQSQQIKHEKGERMKIVQNQLKSISNQKQQAIKYVKKQRMLYQIQSVLHQVLRSNSEYQLKKVKDKIDQLERKKQQIIKQQKQKLAKQQEKLQQIRKLKAEQQKIQKQILRDRQKVQQMVLEDNNLKSQISYNSQDQIKYQKKIQQLNVQFTKIVQESNEIQKKLPQNQSKLNKMKKQVQQMSKQLSKYDKPQLRQKIKILQAELKKINYQKTSFLEKKQSLLNQIQRMNSNKQDFSGKTVQYKQIEKENLERKAKIQVALQIAQKQYKQTLFKMQQQKYQKSNLKNQYDNIQITLKQKSTQIQQQGQFNNMFNQIMRENIPGVIGRLGDLGTISRQYDEIMTTACGRLDNIVVENYQAATQVLNLLKRNKLGRVTCIILDKISEFTNYMNKPFNCPPNCVRLFDLINTDSQKVKTAFYFALSNTLYCQNSDIGIQIAMNDDQNRRRVISKKRNGYIIYEMNGLMNSVYPKKGGFNKKTQQNKKNHPNDNKQIQRKLEEIFKNIQIKNQLILQYQKKIKKFNNNFQAMKSQIVLVQGRLRQIKQQLKEIQKQQDKNNNKQISIQKYTKQITAINKQLDKIQVQVLRVQSNLSKVQNQQNKYENEQIRKLRQRFKIQKAELNKFSKQIQKQEAVITSVQKRIKQNHQKKQQANRMIIKIQKLIQKSKQDIIQLQEKGLQLFKRIQHNTNLKQKYILNEQQLKKTLQSDEQSVKESRKKIQEAKLVVDNVRRQIRKYQQDYKFACSQLQRIRKMYVQMTSTYDFLNDLQDIQRMSIQNSMSEHSSILDLTIPNMSSTDMRQNRKGNVNKIFDVRKLDKVDPLKDLNQDILDSFLLFEDRLRSLLSTQSVQLKRLDGKNLQVISQFKIKFTDFKQKQRQFEQIKQKQNQLKRTIDQLKQQRFIMFRQGFSIINTKIKQVYQLLTNGGDAQLQMIDSLDPFSDGVNFSVRPPKKAWKQINKLSGGQKTLSSLSLIFALHYYKPTPLYFMDEIDAALDFKNVSIVGDYIKKRTKDAQFIIISLRNNMFDLADKLVGVYKTHDQTHVINLEAAKLLAKIQMEKKEKENQNNNHSKSINN